MLYKKYRNLDKFIHSTVKHLNSKGIIEMLYKHVKVFKVVTLDAELNPGYSVILAVY